jgi:hypothetical protein
VRIITAPVEDPIFVFIGVLLLFAAALVLWGLACAFDRWHQRATVRWAARKVVEQDRLRASIPARRPPPGPPYRMPPPPRPGDIAYLHPDVDVRQFIPPRVDLPPTNEDR